jgi:hypothetical protein
MARFLAITRYLIIVPLVGLDLAAAAFFVLGGVSLVRLLVEITVMSLGLAKASHAPEQEVIEQRKGQGSVAPDFDE